MILLDTSVCIKLRDGDAVTLARASKWRSASISIVTQVELEAGLLHPVEGKIRRLRLEQLLAGVAVHDFGTRESEAYAAIITNLGFSRRKLLDRMIAATALVRGLPLATMNPADFAEVAGLEVLNWGN